MLWNGELRTTTSEMFIERLIFDSKSRALYKLLMLNRYVIHDRDTSLDLGRYRQWKADLENCYG